MSAPEPVPAASAAAPAPADIVVEDVGRSFGAVQAVRSVRFTARAGEVTGLVGPNGSGKTTLLLMLATLLVPDRGTIRIGEHDPVTESAAVRATLGWMPDVLGSWANLTVRRSLVLTARLYGITGRAADDRAAELVELVDLAELADRPTRVLSRGQKQRMSLARALVHDPRVLLLDEPASGLDPGARIALRVLLRRLAAEGRTIVVSSHVLAELDELADRAVFLEAGSTVSADRVEAARVAERGWRIRALDAEGLREALRAQGIDADRIVAEPQGLVVPLAGDERAAELLAALVGAGIRVVSFAPAVGDLEHTFLDLNSDGEAAR
ncbi:ABC transporter ATP-binding protein [Protaetiibacter mangrovi]|uniref:ABC transporter ATP-binding protein n=1 Tax=Protaetiibacter mangrovi TaxID=2970926 RepID=A0ABT1ZDY6_9MICO|nr:ABC transporter ATP-binding protein [Protaetiibacter mangrovi]MCS0498908.1 ABC transporter ATP-binding protein [Protaetiibacter mangrovi]TPX04585.1 ABC transporter ATP-binding protein [Schumannella luteola]